jgi:poly(beta-D-mannuronate) lyase
MNGVPNSPINRYHQVEDSLIENNSLINVDHIQLAAGSDAERSAAPLRTEFKNNLVYNADKRDPFTIYDDISGISFTGNVINDAKGFQIPVGFKNKSFTLKSNESGLMEPKAGDAGISSILQPIEKQQLGPNWYPKPQATAVFDQGETISVEPGLDTISRALNQAGNSDILSLAGGAYTVSRVLLLDKAITLKATSKSPNAVVSYERGALFEIQDGGSLKLSGLKITGSESPDSSGNAVIRTQRRSMLGNYDLLVENCEVVELDINHSFDFLNVTKGTFAGRIEITNSKFKNITGWLLALDKESDDYGIYNAEYVSIRDSHFESLGGNLVDFYRGGTDESTFGPHFELSRSTVNKVGFGKRNKSNSSILLHGVQVTNISNNKFADSPAITVMHTVGEPVTRINNNKFINTPAIIVKELNSDKSNTAELSSNIYQQSQD